MSSVNQSGGSGMWCGEGDRTLLLKNILGKCIVQNRQILHFEQMHFTIWTNTFGQIHQTWNWGQRDLIWSTLVESHFGTATGCIPCVKNYLSSHEARRLRACFSAKSLPEGSCHASAIWQCFANKCAAQKPSIISPAWWVVFNLPS